MSTESRILDDERPKLDDDLEVDLSGGDVDEVRLYFEHSDGTLVVNETATSYTTTGSPETVEYEFSDGDLNRTGSHEYRWVITFDDGDVQSFPDRGTFDFFVDEQLNRGGSVDTSVASRAGPIDVLEFNELGSDPTAPAVDDWALFFKTDGNLYKIDENGTVTQVGGGGSANISVEDDGTEIVASVSTLNLAGSDFDVTNPTGDEVTVVLTSDSLTVAGNSVSLGGSTTVDHADLSNIGADDHHAQDQSANYKDGGSFEIDAADLAAGLGMSGQFLQSDGAAASWATAAFGDLTGTASLAQLAEILDGNDDVEAAHLAAANLPSHASRHSDGGADELDVADLAGALGSADTVPLSDGAAVSWSTVPNAGLTNNSVTVTAGAGLTGGGSVSLGNSVTLDAGLDVDDSGTDIIATHGLNFDQNLSVTDDGDGTVTIDASTSGGSAVEAQEDGTSLSTDIALINWAAGLTATEPATDEIQVDVDESEIDHDSLQNFSGSEHFTESSISHDNIDQSTVSEDDHHVRGGFARGDVTSTSTTASPWDSLWVDTSAAGGAVTVTLPTDGSTADGDRVRVVVEDATNNTDVAANTGQSIIGSNPTLTNAGETLEYEYKAATSTWAVIV